MPASDSGDTAAVRMLIQDQQVHLEPGRRAVYMQVAYKIQTPQGLGAGHIAFPWRPETDTVTIHKLQIHRGEQVIDVLASGQTFTVLRRETNLENAMLDGMLTASIQPEGLRVGDVLDYAATNESSDPVLEGHVEQVGALWNTVPIDHAHLRIEWSSALPVRVQSAHVPDLKTRRHGDFKSIELTLKDIEPLVLPEGAPLRFRLGRIVEATDFGSWAEISALMAPLYEKAATLNPRGPLAAEVERIRTTTHDPKTRAEAALALVQDRVRYVALNMGTAGLVPTDAETTWARRFGDCKGKTALLLALLHALKIEAQPVAVNTRIGDALKERLPMVGLFDHVLVRATIGGRDYWLDGTRIGDKRLDNVPTPAFGWGLPLVPKDGALVRIMPPPLDEPTNDVAIHIDATAGLTVPAPVKVETVLRGDPAIQLNAVLSNLSADARDRALRDYWRKEYDFIDVDSVGADFDAPNVELRLAMTGKARMDWSGERYETDGTDLGYKADFSRDPGPDQDAPFAVAHPFYTRTVETIALPPGSGHYKIGDNAEVAETIAGVEYRRHTTLEHDIFTIKASQRSIASEFPAREAPDAQAALRTLNKRDVYLRLPQDYVPTEQEVALALRSSGKTTADFERRGHMLVDRGRFDEAIAEFDQALALDPRNAAALAARGIARAQTGDREAAVRDVAAAAAIDSRNAVVLRAQGILAQRRGAPKDAIAAYTTVLEVEPGDYFALGHRAEAYAATGNSEQALSDAAAAIKKRPGWIDLFVLRANLLRVLGRSDDAVAVAADVVAANPDNNYAHVAAARIYHAYDRRADALREINRALAIKPEPYIYLNRSQMRPREDLAARRADVEAALRLDPDFHEALVERAQVAAEAGDHAGAIDFWTSAIKTSKQRAGLLVERGIAYARTGQQELAEKDFAVARAAAGDDASILNELCWKKATAGVALQSALEECQAAVAAAPDAPAVRDSLAFVLLRLGKLDEAVVEYGRALSKAPTLAASLFGRAVAWSRKGEKAKAEADLAAARKSAPKVQEVFAEYGVTLSETAKQGAAE